MDTRREMNRSLVKVALLSLATLGSLLTAATQTPAPLSIPDENMVGNVFGTVADAASSQPVVGAEILLFDPSAAKDETSRVIPGNRGDFRLSASRLALRKGTTNDRGQFLINFVPTPFPFKTWTIVVRAAGHKQIVIDQVRVLPGAAMALQVDCRLTRGNESEAITYSGADRDAPVKYRHERTLRAVAPRPAEVYPPQTRAVTRTVFATQEGLVGFSTANGHVIAPHDRFVALPSRRALNLNDQTYDFQVELTHKSKAVRAPVWDVGPWNTKDDYWNPSTIREMWQDLAAGTPEAQAAFSNGYNGGHDQSGRDVLNPAGIDLADGTFLDDLALPDNAWISVAFLWRPEVAVGQRVQTTATLNVRSTPGGSLVGQVPAGAKGTVTGGPQGASYNQRFYVWWNIQWDNGVTRGWSVENWLVPVRQPAAARSAWSLYE
jgi:hypothetical protein